MIDALYGGHRPVTSDMASHSRHSTVTPPQRKFEETEAYL
jgi:hypothetical protein